MTQRPPRGSGVRQSSSDAIEVPRRRFLAAVVTLATSHGLVACNGDPPEVADSEAYFPQSVASGDPRPESVVLWTRYVDPDGSDELELELEVARDAEFSDRVELDGASSLELVARAESDFCVKVRVDGLEPGTTYYYRFSAAAPAGRRVSRTGRTRTAPAPDADTRVRFAVISCQDYGGRYYHVLAHLAEQDLDFVVHLGDYVYETTGDPAFQEGNVGRQVVFGDESSALERDGYFAARSLDNYRDLYRICRTDRDLRLVHERFPMIAVWDDHEFSNDSHGAEATYLDGRESELDLERRRNADQAWFEYMPVDFDSGPSRALDPARDFPDDFAIHRSFVFGRHVELVMTDLRRYRPDHVVAEDAFPGAVFADEATLGELLGELPGDAAPYVDVNAFAGGSYRDALRGLAGALDFDPERVAGLVSVPWINQTLAGAGLSEPPPIADDEADGRGYAYHQLLKTSPYGAFGARYLVAEAPFHALAALRFRDSGGASERLMGESQRAWFLDTIRASTRTFKVWGNEFTLLSRAIDLSNVTIAPPEMQQRLLLSAEDWDGAPNERDALLGALAEVENVVVVTGDIHAFFAGRPHPRGAADQSVVEFVCGSVSSTTWARGIEAALELDPSIPPGTALLARAVGDLLVDDEQRPNPHLAHSDLEMNGYAVLDADGERLSTTFFRIEPARLTEPRESLAQPLESYFESLEFRVPSGSRTLERRAGDVWERWDPEAFSWVS
jgi:alkaline phosphatase D